MVDTIPSLRFLELPFAWRSITLPSQLNWTFYVIENVEADWGRELIFSKKKIIRKGIKRLVRSLIFLILLALSYRFS